MIPACNPGHEAAHALVAELVGCRIQSVTVCTDGSGGYLSPGFFGAVGAHPEGFGVTMMAGLAAELRFDPDFDRGWEHVAGDRQALESLGHTEAEMIRWWREADALLAGHDDAWRRLTSLLVDGGTIDGDSVRAVIAGEPGSV